MIFNKPYRVVIIDDDDSILALLRKYLSHFEGADLTFSTFTDPDDALIFIENHSVHIVITDLNLEEQNGSEIISKCIALEKGLQVIALSQDKKVLTAIDCFNRGAKYYLDKPIDKELFKRVVKDCIDFLDRWHEIVKDRLHHEDKHEPINFKKEAV